jgi:hypothetical protein
LLKSGLLRVAATDAAADPPLLARSLRLDDRVVRALIGDDALDSQLVTYCQRIHASIGASRPDHQAETARRLVRYATLSAQESARPLRLLFSGPATSAKSEAATDFADGLGQSLLIANLDRSSEWRTEPTTVAMLLVREATLSNAILYLDGLPESAADKQATAALLRGLAFHPGIVILATDLVVAPDLADDHRILRVPFQLPEHEARRALWQRLTGPIGIHSNADTLNKLSSTFQLAPEQIEVAVAIAKQRLNWRVSQGESIEEASGLGAGGRRARRRRNSPHSPQKWLPSIAGTTSFCQRTRSSNSMNCAYGRGFGTRCLNAAGLGGSCRVARELQHCSPAPRAPARAWRPR